MKTAEAAKHPLSVRLFGTFEACVDGTPLPSVRSRKILWTLALLALRNGRPVEREGLARTLWPDVDLAQALANLRPALSGLRTALGKEGDRIVSPERRSLRLDLEGAFVDVALFDQAVASFRSTDLERAVELYRGPLLENCGEEWASQERDARERTCVEVLVRLGEIATKARDFTTAAERYRRAAALSPLADAPQRGLMEALIRSGDRNGALDVYRRFADRLRAEINADPDEATSKLYFELRRQIREDGRGSPPRSGPTRPAGWLPHSADDLIGREEERTEVGSQIRRSRLVTLVGPGGIGKTRLALETAREVAHEFADGAWWVALESLANDDLLERHVASAFGLREEPGRAPAGVLADYLRSKRLLLALDNCEHLLRASARLVDRLLRDCAGLKILATSRESLGLSGERIWSVPSLPYPNLDHLPESPRTRQRVLAGYESVELFVARATAAHRAFALTPNNATAVARICAHVEGIPLAIELAAARTKAMTVDEIAQRLNEGLGLLSGSRNLPARQRTLRATLDWSYGLLSDDERRILRRLSVFSGGWTLAAAERVVSGGGILESEVADLLESLVDKSLVGFDDVRGRYRLSEPVRQYAAEAIEASDAPEAIERAHADWCVGFAETADGRLRGRDHRTWMARLVEERDNFRSALDRRPTVRLAGALGRFWHITGGYEEGVRYLTDALAQPVAESTAELAARAKALAAAGESHLAQSEYAKAKACFEASLELGHTGSLSRMAWIAHEQGDDDVALRLGEASLAAARLSNDRAELASSLMTQAETLLARSGGALGTELIAEALALYRTLEDEIGIGNALTRLAHFRRSRQDSAVTLRQHREALDIFEALDDRSGMATAHIGIAQEASRVGDYFDALPHWREALGIYQALGDRRGVVVTLAFLGKALAMTGEPVEAKELLGRSLSLSKTVSANGGAITTVECLAVVVARLGRYDLATQLIAYSDLLRGKIGSTRGPQGVAEHSERAAQALSMLGEERFRREWKAGEALDEDKILSLMSDL